MALEDILRAMEQQAHAEIARVKAQAEAEVAAIIAQVEEEAGTIKTRHLASVMPRIERERGRLLSEAKLAARREAMAQREALIEEAFATAGTQFAGLREKPGYPDWLARLAREVVEALGRELRIVVDARDETLMRRITAELGVEAGITTGLRTAGGLEASTPDGRIVVINTVEARLGWGRESLRREIAGILNAEEASWKPIMAMAMPASAR